MSKLLQACKSRDSLLENIVHLNELFLFHAISLSLSLFFLLCFRYKSK